MDKDEFVLGNKEEVEYFETHLKEYLKTKTNVSLSKISLSKAYEPLHSRSDGAKVFSALLDIVINFSLLYCDITEISGTWNRLFAGTNSSIQLKGGSILDSQIKFAGKMDIHRFSSSYVLRYRSLWDKIMGFIVILYSPENYDKFAKSKSRKKSFRKIAENIPEISEEFINSSEEAITRFDETFRTSEAHGVGRLRKWSLSMQVMADNPSIELIWFWNRIIEIVGNLENMVFESASKNERN